VCWVKLQGHDNFSWALNFGQNKINVTQTLGKKSLGDTEITQKKQRGQ